jgi:tRNA (Thr-GGU) A37 N-methylase
VEGLDAINGTPVLDVKPYYPQYDRIEEAAVPVWVNNLMKNYF